jgi:hypothetical protein
LYVSVRGFGESFQKQMVKMRGLENLEVAPKSP